MESLFWGLTRGGCKVNWPEGWRDWETMRRLESHAGVMVIYRFFRESISSWTPYLHRFVTLFYPIVGFLTRLTRLIAPWRTRWIITMIERHHHDHRLELSWSITADFHYDEGNKRASRFRLTYIFMARR